jgi:hypothetical protein
MRSYEFITEGREAPIYHYTSLKNFAGIINSDTLNGRNIANQHSGVVAIDPTISFTRDYNRTVIPGAINSLSVGFRVDQNKLTHRFKMRSANQTPAEHGPKFEKGLDKDTQKQIKTMRSTGVYPGYSLSINGSDIKDIAKGTVGRRARWESEEVVIAKSIPNFSKYITGIVLPVGSGKRATTSVEDFLKKLPESDRALIINTANRLSIPLIWNKQEFNASELLTLTEDRVHEFINESVPLKFHTIELQEDQIKDYVIRYIEENKIDTYTSRFIINIMRSTDKRLYETTEFQDIQTFVTAINRIDSKKKIKVGDKFSVLFFDIITLWKEIHALGFIKPKEVTEIQLHKDGSINFIRFSDGSRYPRLNMAVYDGKQIEQSAYFVNDNGASEALTMLILALPDGWVMHTNNIEGAD